MEVRGLAGAENAVRCPVGTRLWRPIAVAFTLAFVVATTLLFAVRQWHAILTQHLLQPLTYPQYDFVVYYAAAVGLARGGNIYDMRYLTGLVLPELRNYPTPTVPPYLYPPHLAFLLRPLTLLTPQQAQVVWFLGSLISYCLTVYLLWRGCRTDTRRWLLLPAVSLAASFLPTQEAFRMGQVDIALLFVIALSLHALTQQQRWLPSFGLALAAVVKVAPLPLLLFAAYRRPRCRLVSGLAFGLLLLLGLAAGGISLNVHYFTNVLPAVSDPIPWVSNQSLGGFVGRLWEPATAGRVQAIPLTSAKVLTSLVALPFLGMAGAACWPRRDARAEPCRLRLQFGLLTLLILLCSSPSWYSRLSWMMLPYLVTLDAVVALPTLRARIAGLSLLGVSYLLVQVWSDLSLQALRSTTDVAARQMLSTPLFGMIVLFGLLFWLLRRIDGGRAPEFGNGG